MNRISHARITLGQYLFLLLVTGVAFWSLWNKQVVIAILAVGLLTVSIEKLIHTTYTVTADGNLVLYYGRFLKSKTIAVNDVSATETVCSMNLFGFRLMRCVLVHHGDKAEALMPVKEEEFVKCLRKAMCLHNNMVTK